MKFVGSFFSLLAVTLWADCPVLLTTSFGAKGATTVTISQKGEVEIWEDGFTRTEEGRVARFNRDKQHVSLGNINTGVRSFAAEPIGAGSEQLLAVVDDSGLMKVVSSLGRVYPFLIPGAGKVSAVALYTKPIGQTAIATSLTRGPVAKWEGVELFFASGKHLFRAHFRPRYIDPNQTDIQQMLMRGLAKITTEPAKTPGARPKTVMTNPLVEMIDFNVEATYLLATSDATRALEVSSFERVVSITDPTVLSGIDFLSMVDDRHVLMGSKLGQVVLVDFKEKSLVKALSFPKPVILGSLSGHRVGENFEVWGLNQSDGAVFRWHSKKLANFFQELPKATPEGIRAVAISSLGHAAPVGYTATKEAREGFFSNFVILPNKIVVERVLVLGSDGNLYAWVDSSEITMSSGPAKRGWVKWEAPSSSLLIKP